MSVLRAGLSLRAAYQDGIQRRNYCMETFHRWLAEQDDRDILTPDQKVVPTVAAAGSLGLTRRELTQRFERELDRETLWQLLDALVGIGELVAVNDGDDVKYVAPAAVSG